MAKAIKWEVASAPTGMYRSFERRGWPSATYADGRIAATISCEDDYVPRLAKTGEHAPLTVRVADYTTPKNNCPWQWRRMVGTFVTVKDAKEAFAKLIEAKPEIGGLK